MNYYNEFDPFAAEWLRELIRAGHIPFGVVDERDIRTVETGDLRDFKQCHFFAGIGGWAYALRLAGWPDDRPVWTGSPPCQPFSAAGKGLGIDDERHLAPHFLSLVASVRPPVLFGEQVAAAVTKDNWLDDLLDALEREGYSTGAAVLPACSVGAPHIRQRLFFAARRLADAACSRSTGQCRGWEAGIAEYSSPGRLGNGNGNGNGEGLEERVCNRRIQQEARRTLEGKAAELRGDHGGLPVPDSDGPSHANYVGWDAPDWLYCRDRAWRPVESGTFPLAYGVPARVGRLRGYGNAIVPQVAAEVIRTVM